MTYREEIAPGADRFIRAGGFLQVLNHPDIHQRELFEWLAELPDDDRLDWTAGEVADWWAKTHVTGAISVRRDGESRFTVEGDASVRGLVIELRHPDGRLGYHALDRLPATIDGAAPGACGLRELAGRPRSKAAVERRWKREIGPAFAALAANGSKPVTARINSDLVPERADGLLRLLAELTGGRDLNGARVLDAGCGLGALTSYLALSTGADEVVGVDERSDQMSAAGELAAAHRIIGLEFRIEDMRALHGLEDSSFDLIIANNALTYLRDHDAVVAAAEAFARVLRPGGRLLIQQPSKWRLREPLTGAPPVHLVPPGVAEFLRRSFGWEHSHHRLRLFSPRETQRILRGAGFEDVRVAGLRRGRLMRGPATGLASFYAVAGRLPG